MRSFASMVALGARLGWLRQRSRSILPSIAAQAAFFAVLIREKMPLHLR